MTRTQLAKLYSVHYKTFLCWMQDIPELANISKRQRILTPLQVRTVFAKMGVPANLPKSLCDKYQTETIREQL